LESVTDNTPPQKEFAAKNNVQFPRLSDFAKRHLSTDYGVLLPDSGVANRSTFVIDEEGKIVYIEQGNTARGARRRAVARAHKK
jgi:peroxiredoxin